MFRTRLTSLMIPATLAMILPLAGAAPVPDDLRCEWRVGNEAVRDICPELYWQAEGQVACEVLVATTEALLAPGRADMWGTGRMETRLPIVEYAGEPLADETTYHWKVRVWDADGPGEWSGVQRFTTDFEPRPSLRPHMRYFINFCPGGPELVANQYDLSFCAEGPRFRPEHIGLRYALMATMVVPSDKCDQLAAWCAREGIGEVLSEEGVPEAMFCHFATETSVTLHVGAERASNPRETRAIPGWDPRNDRNGDGVVDDAEFANLVNPEAKARRWSDARIPIYYWGPPRDDYIMNIGHPQYQRFLAEEHLPSQLGEWCSGWWIDTTTSNVPGAGGSANVVEYPRGPGEEDKWMRDMQMLMATVKIANPDVLFSANGWEATPFILDGRETEGWLNMTMGGGGFESRLRNVAALDARGKFHMAQYNPIWAPDRSEFGPKVPITLERDHMYGLAAYYLCMGERSYFGYGRHGGYGVGNTWYQPVADYDIGEPEGPYERIVISRAADVQAENLLTNGDFEIDADGDNLPDGWLTALPLEFDEEVVKSGQRSVRVDSDGPNINNINKWMLELEPDTAYTFSGWMKTKDITGGSGAQMYVYDFEGGQTGGISMVLHGINDWTYMSQTFRTGEDTTGRVNFRVYGSTGTAWFDDLRVVKGAHSDVVVYARRFTKALVLVRPSEPALGWGDDTAIEYELDGRYRLLDINGEPGEPTDTVTLRLGEAAILAVL